MTSHIYCWKSRGISKSVSKGNERALLIQGEEMTAQAHQQRPHNHQPNASTDNTHSTTPSDYAKCAIVTGGITRGTIGELISLPITITLWDSSTSAMGDANTFTFFILSRFVILPTPTTGATTTPARS
ncbi:hypothetical protein PVK06_001524 [Gossypium arboreum]|uniref:Uncharacterized protein n=1 Tax=Gossypium arboreum TaxID=29729 RepID=A0ABR0R1B7_GOSAR|nr:hypothetical protein PVK06_001524 [Gossypium arboreum]